MGGSSHKAIEKVLQRHDEAGDSRPGTHKSLLEVW